VSIVNSGFSAIGRLAALALLLGAFIFGMAGVVYMSLQGEEVKVPEITGKNFAESEKELAALGLKIKKRADRFSTEMPNTVIEQLPKTGETVKTGQLILVVTSKGPGEGDQPASLKNTTEEDDTEKIEEMISDKPKKPKANSNTTRKKADTARDVSGNTSEGNTAAGSTNKKDPGSDKEPGDKPKDPPANSRAPSSPPKPPAGNKPAPRP
jgi:beta-lactam-binding protein with PASTA domain